VDREIYITETELQRASFNFETILHEEKVRAALKCNMEYIVFKCGDEFFKDLISHPSLYMPIEATSSLPLFLLRNYIKIYGIKNLNIENFVVIKDVIFLIEFNTEIKTDQAEFHAENYTSILKDRR